jgi:hypothetical protein
MEINEYNCVQNIVPSYTIVAINSMLKGEMKMATKRDNLTKSISFRCTESEHEMITNNAYARDQIRSEYSRQAAINYFKVLEEYQKLKDELPELKTMLGHFHEDMEDTKLHTEYLEVLARFILKEMRKEEAFKQFRDKEENVSSNQ